MIVVITCNECKTTEKIKKEEIQFWECSKCKKTTEFSVRPERPKASKIRYQVAAYAEKESAWNDFEEAMWKNGTKAVWEEDRTAAYVVSEVIVDVVYDIEKKKFEIESIDCDGEKFFKFNASLTQR